MNIKDFLKRFLMFFFSLGCLFSIGTFEKKYNPEMNMFAAAGLLVLVLSPILFGAIGLGIYEIVRHLHNR